MINAMILGLEFMLEHDIIANDLRERAIAEYKAALKMPRKKKKQAKKSALLLYSIANYNPLNF